jgi:hypothetical protein
MLVLGSRQSDDIVDLRVARAKGVNIVRRRSGGGAVLVGPDRCLWIDVPSLAVITSGSTTFGGRRIGSATAGPRPWMSSAWPVMCTAAVSRGG